MSEDNQSVDAGDLEEAKSGLAHVETKEGTGATVKPIFKCAKCGATQDIPDDILVKMENDEDISGSIPSHCDEPMKISVAG